MTLDGKPVYGRRLMPSILDEQAKANPNKLFAAIPIFSDVEKGFRDVTFADAARCINFMAQWIEDRFGRSQDFATISYIGIADLRGPLLFQAAVKCGYKFLLPSPRNPAATNVSLMNQTKSTILLFAPEVEPLVKTVHALEPSIRVEAVPSFDEMLHSNPEHYPYEKTYHEAKDEPAVVLHSSGSTGLPKPIIMTHGSFSVLDNEHNLPPVPGRRKRDWTMWSFEGEGRVYTAFPFFHLGGFLMHTVATVFGNTSIVMGPPNMIPDGALLRSVMTHQKLRALLLPPAVIEQILHEPNGIEYFKGLDFVTYGGAPMKQETGTQLLKVVPIGTPYGSTESYPIPELVPIAPEDWEWHEFNPIYKYEMELYDSKEGTYELVIIADEDAKATCAVYHNLPGVGRFHTKDLWKRHPDPEKPQLYKYYGRRDDIIVLENGEKFNPVPFELNLQAHPSLQGALVVGNRRTQAVLLIEPKESLDEEARKGLVEKLQPLIDESNALLPGQGRIHHGNVLCARPDKPFVRTGKGTIVRKLTEDAYQDEIEQVYSAASEGSEVVPLKPTLKLHYDLATVDEFLRRIISSSFPAGATIGGDEDFFAYGLDSVQTLQIVASLKRNLQSQASKSVSWISPRTIFYNPTINDLSRLICTFLNEGEIPSAAKDNTQSLDATIATYVDALPRRPPPNLQQESEAPRNHIPSAVAVIGSTGYLGSHLIATLLRTPTVSRIYCLNRSSHAQAKEKQEKALREIDATFLTSSFEEKLTYCTVQLGKPKLGLAPEAYEQVARDADVLVYNAWRLDFGLALRSFAPFLRATADIVELASHANGNGNHRRHHHPMHIVFVSSLSSIGQLATTTRAPEAAVADARAPFRMGYGQSKHAAERILAAAHRVSGVPVSIVRVCQIGGPTAPTTTTTGVQGTVTKSKWADQPWLSALARTARTLGCVPGHVAAVDWVAVDTAAAMLRDFALRPASTTPRDEDEPWYYHISHPEPLRWDPVVEVLCKLLDIPKVVPLWDWVALLRAAQEESQAAEAAVSSKTMPALTMLDFFEELGEEGAENSTYATEQAVATFQGEFHVLDTAILESWLGSWDL